MVKKQKSPDEEIKAKQYGKTIGYCVMKKSVVGGNISITNNNNQKVTIGYCGVTNPTNSKVRLSLRLVKT